MTNKRANFTTNPEGPVYHLGLIPGDICPFIITAGDSDHVSVKDKLLTIK